MADRPRTIPDLPRFEYVDGEDLIILEKRDELGSETGAIEVANFISTMIAGPFADDSEAEAAGVKVGSLYFTEQGNVRVRVN